MTIKEFRENIKNLNEEEFEKTTLDHSDNSEFVKLLTRYFTDEQDFIENELINIYANAGDNVELKLNILNMLNGFRY